jgi:hypothetical protein
MSELAVSDLEYLGDLAEQTRHGRNFKSANVVGRYNRGWAISPAFERAKAARPAKPVPPPAIIETPIEVATPAPSALPEITDYQSLISCLRARADGLQISRESISELAGLPDRYAAKVLSLSSVKRVGMISLGPLLSALSIKLVAVVVDEEALKRNRVRYVERDKAHTKSAKDRWERPPGMPTRRQTARSGDPE